MWYAHDGNGGAGFSECDGSFPYDLALLGYLYLLDLLCHPERLRQVLWAGGAA